MGNLLCLIGLHRWGRWSSGRTDSLGFFVQARRCSRCNACGVRKSR